MFLFNFFLFTRWRERGKIFFYLKFKKWEEFLSCIIHTEREQGWVDGGGGPMAPRIWEVESGSGTLQLHPLAPFVSLPPTAMADPIFIWWDFFILSWWWITFFSFSYSIRHQPCLLLLFPPIFSFYFFFFIPPPLFLKSLRGLLDREWGPRIRNRGNAINPFYFFLSFFLSPPISIWGNKTYREGERENWKRKKIKINSFSF